MTIKSSISLCEIFLRHFISIHSSIVRFKNLIYGVLLRPCFIQYCSDFPFPRSNLFFSHNGSLSFSYCLPIFLAIYIRMHLYYIVCVCVYIYLVHSLCYSKIINDEIIFSSMNECRLNLRGINNDGFGYLILYCAGRIFKISIIKCRAARFCCAKTRPSALAHNVPH